MTDYKDGIRHGIKLSINALFEALISGIGDRQLVANEIVWAVFGSPWNVQDYY